MAAMGLDPIRPDQAERPPEAMEPPRQRPETPMVTPMSNLQKGLLIAAGVLVALGIGLGLFRAVYDFQGVRCGTAFREDMVSQFSATMGTRSVMPQCDQPLSDAKVLPIVLIGLGLSAGAAGVYLRPRNENVAGLPTSPA